MQSGSVKLKNITQSNSSANVIGSITLSPGDVSVDDCSFGGNFFARSTKTITITGSEFKGMNNSLISPRFVNVEQSKFTSGGSNTTFNKSATASASDDWYGGNDFDNLVLTNESNFDIKMNVTEGDNFFFPAIFNNIGGGNLWIASVGTCNFASEIVLNNTSVKGIWLGATTAGNFATIGGNIITTGFSNGPLELRRLDQTKGSTPNGLFNPTTFLAENARLRGAFSVGASISITLKNSIFNRTNNFTAPSIPEVTGCTFSNIANTATTFTKTGGLLNTWSGDNTFGVVNIVNNSGGTLRLAGISLLNDRFNGKATFQQLNAEGELNPCFTASCRFRDTISTIDTVKEIVFGGPSSGRVFIDGNKAQILQADAIPPVFRRITMQTTGDLTLNTPLVFRTPGASNFLNGIIRTDAVNYVLYESNSTPMNMSDASHIDGPVRRNGNTTGFLFPTGNNGKYAPVTLSNPSGPFGTFEVQYFNTPFPSDAVDASLEHVSACEYWEVNRLTGGAAVDVTMTWDNVRSCGITDLNELKLARFDGANWTNLGGLVTGVLPSGTITASGVSSFSPFTLASTAPRPANPLPIELLFFRAKPNGKVVDLTWATASEKDNDYFTVERSKDGIRFDPVLKVPGAGNSTEALYYYEVDERPLPGISYYRLKQTDFDGTFSYSNIVAVQMPVDDQTFAVFPNPADDHFVLETGADPAELRYRLLNSMGQTMPVTPVIEAGRLRFSTQGFPAGLYFLEVRHENAAHSLKVVVR